MERWKTSRILLPADLAGRSFRDVLTGADVRPTVSGREAWLFAGQVFETMPAAIIVG
jgi:hypothetical protein